MADYLNIAGRVRTTASDGVAMEAQEVKDLNLNKSQQEVNADVQTELGDRYTKEETYNREELNELITTPDVNRVYVIATNLTTAVTDLLPETGSSDTLYNVGNWDGTQYDTTVYSIYGWDGTAYVCLAVRSSIGEVYDISANHPDGQGNPTPYADLAAALGTGGANVPADIRRGGMSIKFIQGTAQSSDHKYVRFNLLATSFTTDTTQWAIDDVGVYVENPEFVYVQTDNEDKILFGIKVDGEPYFGVGCPKQVKEYVEQKIEDLPLDEYEDIVTFLSDYLGGDATLKSIIDNLANTKVDKETGKSLIDAEYANGVHYIENPEFVYVKTDAEDKILWAIKIDGGIYYGAGCPQQVKDYIEEKIAELSLDEYEDIVAFLSDYLGSDTTLKAMIDSINERIPELIENPEFVAVTEDANGKVLDGVRKDGVKVEYCDVIFPNGIPKQIKQYLPESIKESNPLSFGSNYRGNSQTLNEPSYLMTLSNVYNDKKGWLKTVRFYTNTAGIKTLHIGYIDQRTTAIIRLSFNCNAIVGFNEVDISEKHIIIEENETLFITANSISFDALGSTDNYPQMLSGQSNGVLERYDSEYGASLYFNWDVVELSSLYSFKADTDIIEENVGSLSSSVNALEKNINKVYDNNGNAYKLKIVNGELTPILQQFGNVLVIGNSVTRHPYNDSPGTRWLVSNRGMASTIIDNDYCHLLREGLRVKVPQAQVTTCDGYQWERNLPTDKNTLRAYLEDYSGTYDLVVFALSENIASIDSNSIYNSCKAFFEVILEKWPDTTVLVTSTRMCIGESPNSPYGYKDIAIQKAARAMKFDYVDVRQRDYDAFVTNFNTGAWVPIYMNGDNGKFVAQKTVHTHPCDIGMLRIANDILAAIDCQPLENKIFQIATSCSQDYYAPTYWVEGGLATVICYEEMPQVVTVTDSDGNNIPFEIKDMTIEVIDETPYKSPIAGIVFTMPSSNVIVSIN